MKLIILCFFFAGIPFLAWTQTPVPVDLQITGGAGGIERREVHSLIEIGADGAGSYTRYLPGAVFDPPLEHNTFSLSPEEVAEIWHTIELNNFFNLDSAYVDTSNTGGSSVRLSVLANGLTHSVYAENQIIISLQGIISEINRVTPGADDLIYEPAMAPAVFQKDPCEGKNDLITYQDNPDIHRKLEGAEGLHVSGFRQSEPGWDEHPGTVVSCQMTLQEAVESDLATIRSNGKIFGDAVSVTINNSLAKPGNKLIVKLYLEFYGPGATPENVKAIVEDIESKWNGLITSDGRNLAVQIGVRSAPTATSPPGTPGYHQINIVEQAHSEVFGQGTSFDFNRGIGSGTWTIPTNQTKGEYAHEAGHFLGLSDRFDQYEKMPNGWWLRRKDRYTLTNQELAANAITDYPGRSVTQIVDALAGAPIGTQVPVTREGHEDDLMASPTARMGNILQSDIDLIASSQEGILVIAPPGQVFINKNGKQNFVSMHSMEMFVGTGKTKTCRGLYAGCIDVNKKVPGIDDTFDLGPSLGLWSGFEAAPVLLKILLFIEEQELYCGDFNVHLSVWRITDNTNIGLSEVDEFLRSAGVDIGKRFLDFPRMTGTDSTNPKTTFVIPPQFYLPKITPVATLTQIGEAVRLTGSFTKPIALIDSSAQFGWSLVTPESSLAKLSDPKSDTLEFTPDVRGVYYPALSVTTQKTGRSPFTVFVPVAESVVAADSLTETFEGGTLQTGSPFFWSTGSDGSWRVTDSSSHSGKFAVQGTLSTGIYTSSLTVSFSIPDSARISFACWVPSDDGHLKFYINDRSRAIAAWEKSKGWNQVSFALSPGENTLTWNYYHYFDETEVVWLDDIFFPAKASFNPVPVEQNEWQPGYGLSQNYPNPFSDATSIDFSIPGPQRVSLTVFNMIGREVQVLVNERRAAGKYSVDFNTGGLSKGIYFYRLTAGPYRATKKMMVSK